VRAGLSLDWAFRQGRPLSLQSEFSLTPAGQRTPVRSEEEEWGGDLVGKGWDGMDLQYSNVLKRAIIERCKSMLMFCLRGKIYE